MWAAESPSSTGSGVCSGDCRIKRCSPAGGLQSAVRSLLALPSSLLVCAAWAGLGIAVLCPSTAACQEGLPGHETPSLCWSIVLPWLSYRDLCSGLSWAEETCRDLVESLQECEPDLSWDSAFPSLTAEENHPTFLWLGLCPQWRGDDIHYEICGLETLCKYPIPFLGGVVWTWEKPHSWCLLWNQFFSVLNKTVVSFLNIIQLPSSCQS